MGLGVPTQDHMAKAIFRLSLLMHEQRKPETEETCREKKITKIMTLQEKRRGRGQVPPHPQLPSHEPHWLPFHEVVGLSLPQPRASALPRPFNMGWCEGVLAISEP